jgi:hypothetical protein
MSTKHRSARRPVVQFELDTDKLVDAIVTKLAPFLAGRVAAERDVVAGESLGEFCASVSISRSKAYKEIAAGKLVARKAGKKVLITSQAKADWLASLPASEIKQSAACGIRRAATRARPSSK